MPAATYSYLSSRSDPPISNPQQRLNLVGTDWSIIKVESIRLSTGDVSTMGNCHAVWAHEAEDNLTVRADGLMVKLSEDAPPEAKGQVRMPCLKDKLSQRRRSTPCSSSSIYLVDGCFASIPRLRLFQEALTAILNAVCPLLNTIT